MKLQQLRFLAAVADNGLNITIAAEALFTSQPGVSKQIRLLEDELGLKLFVRKGKRIEALTPAGEKVVERARLVLREVQAIKALADELRGEVRGRLSLATTQTQARYVLPPVINTFRQRFPEINVELHQGTSEQIAQMIGERQADFAMATGSEDLFPDVIKFPVYRWDRVVIVPRDHPLASIRKPLSLAALARYPLVTYLFSDRPKSSLMTAFRDQDLAPRIAFTARDSDIIKTYVRTGLGVGIVAGMALLPGTDDDLRVLEARHLFPRLTTWIGFRRDFLLKNFHADFLHLLAPHLEPTLIDDALRGRPVPELQSLISNTALPLRNAPGETDEPATGRKQA
ncbi:MAG: LysR family transcriptional regulator [Wenzhouxiangella sp.]|nr:MAG: LysR family transcriptional regulator [Wenzhouxiangella sp.]